MSTSHNNSDETPGPPNKTTAVLLIGTIGDTTWRMFVPTIGLTIIGVWADNSFATQPWLTILGIVVGTIIAALLVRAQIRNVNK